MDMLFAQSTFKTVIGQLKGRKIPTGQNVVSNTVEINDKEKDLEAIHNERE